MRQCPCSMHAQCTKDATAVERSAQPMHSPGPGPDTVSGDVGRQIVGISNFDRVWVLVNGTLSYCYCWSMNWGKNFQNIIVS